MHQQLHQLHPAQLPGAAESTPTFTFTA